MLPFIYNESTHLECINEDAGQSWCPVTTYLHGEIVKKSWEFCKENCSRTVGSFGATEPDLCESKDSLHKYLQEFFDKSQTNPRVIAKSLKDIGCPFKCQHKEYVAQLVYKKHDDRIGADRARLIIEIDSETDVQNIYRNLLYTLDMFVSDIGSVCGLILGISLLDLINYIIGNGSRILIETKSRDWKKLRLPMYLFVKWTSTLLFITWLIYSTYQDVDILPKVWPIENNKEIDDVIPYDNRFEYGFRKGLFA